MISSLATMPAKEREAILSELSDEECVALLFDWPLWARPSQLPPVGDWRIWLVLSGRGFGKTRLGAEWVRDQVRRFEHVNLIGPTAADYRDVMIEGESGILAVCPPGERPSWYPSRRLIEWPNGAKTLCFSAEDPEQLRGPQHQRLWCDEMAAWANHTRQETWDLAMFGLRLPPDPRALVTTTPKPVATLRELVGDPNVALTKGTTYENRANLAPEFFEQLIGKYEGTRLGRQELDAELLLDEGLAYRLVDGIHIIPRFGLPDAWDRFEAMDYGTSAPTSWGCFATDHDGNIVAHGLYHSPGYPSEHAAAVQAKRAEWWARDAANRAVPALCFAPQDIKTKWSRSQVTGKEISAESEFAEHGITFATAQQDRRAGYIRVAELLRLNPERPFPDWHPLRGEKGAPRLFLFDTEELLPLVQAIRDAPLEDVDSPLSKLPGEAVSEEWESREGHAHAMLRYALMSRPAPSEKPAYVPHPGVRALRDVWGQKRTEASYTA